MFQSVKAFFRKAGPSCSDLRSYQGQSQEHLQTVNRHLPAAYCRLFKEKFMAVLRGHESSVRLLSLQRLP